MAGAKPGEDHPRARLTNKDVLDIHARRARGERVKDIARVYGVLPSSVSQILNGHRWKHITPASRG